MIFGWDQRLKNNNITRNSSCTSKGSVINQRWSTQFPFATFSHIALFGSWTTCFVSATCEKVDHMQMLMFLSRGYSSMVSFILSTTFSVTEIPPRRDSPNCQLLPLYSQFWFTKILKALQVLTFTAFWRILSRPS